MLQEGNASQKLPLHISRILFLHHHCLVPPKVLPNLTVNQTSPSVVVLSCNKLLAPTSNMLSNYASLEFVTLALQQCVRNEMAPEAGHIVLMSKLLLSGMETSRLGCATKPELVQQLHVLILPTHAFKSRQQLVLHTKHTACQKTQRIITIFKFARRI